MHATTWGVAWLLLAGALAACGGTGDRAAAGRLVYVANCAACHNPDPRRDGSMGPAIAGSSRELIEARVLRGEYPPGYTPKLETAVMLPLPYLKDDIDALSAYLSAPGP